MPIRRNLKKLKTKVFHPLVFATMMVTSTGMAKIPPTAFKNVVRHFNNKKSQYNPELGEILLMAGVVENLRFFGPYTPGKKGESRIFAMDKSDDPTWNVCKLLFPSTGGTLTSSSNASSDFGKYVKDPKVVAKLIEFADDLREGRAAEKPNTPKKGEVKKRAFSEYQQELIKLMDNPSSDVKKTVTSLLKYMDQSIQNEGKFYPQYFTEQLVEAFFCHKFDTHKDIEQLVDSLPDNIVNKSVKWDRSDDDPLDTKDIENISEKNTFELEDVFNMGLYESMLAPIPYSNREKPVSNAPTKPYDRKLDKFDEDSKNRFADCVETSLRHLFNMVLYDKEAISFNLSGIKKWQQNFKEDSESFKIIQNLLDFYEVQTPNLSNAGSMEIRSLWNRVVGDLNKEGEKNPITYRSGTHNIASGLGNLSRVITRLMSFDDLANPEFGTKYESNSEKVKEWSQEVFAKLFKTIAPHLELSTTFRLSDYGTQEVTGTINVKAKSQQNKEELFNVNLEIDSHHTQVCEPKFELKTKAEIPVEKIKLAAITAGTTEESVFLLHPDLVHAKITSPIYKLFQKALADNDSKLDFLRRAFASWNLYNGMDKMFGNVVATINWDDNYVQKATTRIFVLLHLRNRLLPEMIDILKPHVKRLDFSSLDQSWFYFVLDSIKGIDGDMIDRSINYLISKFSLSQYSMTLPKFGNKELLPQISGLKYLTIDMYGKAGTIRADENNEITDLQVFAKGEYGVLDMDLNNFPKVEELNLQRIRLFTRGEENLKHWFELRNLGKAQNLEALILYDLKTSELTINAPKLKKIVLSGLEFEALDFKNTSIQSLHIIGSSIGELDVGGIKNSLEEINIEASRIVSSLKGLGGMSKLTGFSVHNTELPDLDLSDFIKMKACYFKSNVGKHKIDLSNSHNLWWFNAVETNLKYLKLPSYGAMNEIIISKDMVGEFWIGDKLQFKRENLKKSPSPTSPKDEE